MHNKKSSFEPGASNPRGVHLNPPQRPTIVLMGVAGSGKTTVGRLLATALKTQFIDADDHHPEHNIQKMARGEPLSDDDRWPWLKRLSTLLSDHEGPGIVLACSALKASYRRILLEGVPDALLIHLRVSPAQLAERLSKRSDHFAKEGLLDSQLATLEEPTSAAQMDGELAPEALVEMIGELILSKMNP